MLILIQLKMRMTNNENQKSKAVANSLELPKLIIVNKSITICRD